MDKVIFVTLLGMLVVNGFVFGLGAYWLLNHTRHTVDAVIALKLTQGSGPEFHRALDKLRETGVVPDVADVKDAGIEPDEPISRIVQVRGAEGEPAETVELIGEGFYDDPTIIRGRVVHEWEDKQ